MNEKNSKFRFAYLNLRENPRGNAMLQRIIEAGHQPIMVIEEKSKLAKKNAVSLTKELKQLLPEISLSARMQEIVRLNNIEYAEVANHNDEHSEEILRSLSLDLIVLGDTRVIRPNILQIPKIGIINIHPGYLPDVRGNNPYVWALVHDLPQGCSVHFIDEDIDTGPIILRKKIHLKRGSTYPQLLFQINQLCGALLAKALNQLAMGKIKYKAQEDFKMLTDFYPTFKSASVEVKNKAKKKLSEGSYKYLIN